LATVVVGGLISSTLLTLILLPVLYEWLENRSDRKAAEHNSQETAS
jgi:cobalt-zinc-cadmium resistance protein CzcA